MRMRRKRNYKFRTGSYRERFSEEEERGKARNMEKMQENGDKREGNRAGEEQDDDNITWSVLCLRRCINKRGN